MTALASGYMTAALNGDIKDRIRYYMIKYAISVMAEDGGTAGHALRVAYAKKILDGTASITEYSIGVYTNGAIAAEGLSPVDGDLEFQVNTIFNAFAGVVN